MKFSDFLRIKGINESVIVSLDGEYYGCKCTQ